MQQELLLRAISNGTGGILIIAVLLVLLIALRKDIDDGEPLPGLFHLTIGVIGLFVFIALLVIYFQAKRTIVPEKISHRMETGANSLPEGGAR
jgi:Na+/melibiose symporter-like transporter